jgi:signal transduction histidine kinase
MMIVDKPVDTQHHSVAYKVAHDLRSPLMSLRGLVSLIRREGESGQREEYFEQFEKCIERMNLTIEDIIHEAKAEVAPRLSEPVNLKQIAQDAIQSLCYMDEATCVEIRLKAEEHGQFVSNQKHLASIFNNLISNAIRYRDRNKKSRLNIEITYSGNEARLVFDDNGLGIEEHNQKLIFGKFFRAHADRKGTGLGLYIVLEAVQHLRGKINLTSKPGVGSTFIFVVPNQV